MNIEFTDKQYEKLVKLVYLGNWMINAIRTNLIKEYDDIAQYVFSFCRKAKLEELIAHDEKSGKFLPTMELDENDDIVRYREEYDDEAFWSALIDGLARRDFIRAYGKDAIRRMEWTERIEKEGPFIDKYHKEFEKHGIERLYVKS